MSRRLIFLLSLVICLFLHTVNGQPAYGQNIAEISANDTDLKLDKYAYIIDDPQGKMTVRDVVSKYNNGEITDKNSDSYLYMDSKPHWFVVPIKNKSEQTEWLIDLGNIKSNRTGLIYQMLIYEATQKIIFYNGLNDHKDYKELIIDNRYLPITIPKNEEALFILYFYPIDYKNAAIPLTIQSQKAETKSAHVFGHFIIDNVTPVIIASIMIVLIGFFVTNATGFIPIVIYYFALLLWILFVEIPLQPNIVGLTIIAPITPIVMALLTSIVCFFTVPVRYSNAIFRRSLSFLIAASVLTIIIFTIGNNKVIPEKYLISYAISSLLLIFNILFLNYNVSHHLKKSNLFLSVWIGINLLAQTSIALESINLLPHYFTFHQADKIGLYIQLVVVFIGVIVSIKAEYARRIANHIRQNQKTASILNAQKNKENSDHSRLLRVIEREREIMEELRARETERTEEMRKAKIIADEANQAKSAFLAVVSHEIRTPMTGIMGMVKMLEDTPLSDEQKDYIMTIGDSGQAMLALLNDILDFSKIEDGSMDLENIEFDLRRVLNSVVMLMKAHSDQKNLQLILNIDSDIPPKLYGDPTRLRQVILNLVGNALKFTSKGHVAIKVEQIKTEGTIHHVTFDISDTGLGISKEAQANLFTPFSQADSSISRKYGGTGLGLAICKTLVEAMNGHISVKSREGAGSTFSFTLPFATELNTKTSKKDTSQQINILKDMRFLVVDDNEINRKVIDGFLKKSNHNTVLFENGQDVLNHLETDKNFDALFLDIEMPGMSGIDLSQHIKDDPTTDHLPLVAITGNVSEDDISRYKNAGFTNHVAKPIEPKELNNVILKLVDQDKKDAISHEEPAKKIKITPSKKTIEKKTTRPVVGKTLDEVMLRGLKEGLGSKQTKNLIDELFIKADEIVGQLIELKKTKDKDSARMRAHELKGMAGNFGLKALSDKSDEIERICKDDERPFSDIEPHIEDLSTLLERSRYSVKEFLSD